MSGTSVMLAPSCEQCGCALDALPAVSAARSEAPAFSLPPFARFLLTRGAILLAALTLYAAGRLGYDAGGASGALIGVGVAGYLLLPCLPERIR